MLTYSIQPTPEDTRRLHRAVVHQVHGAPPGLDNGRRRWRRPRAWPARRYQAGHVEQAGPQKSLASAWPMTRPGLKQAQSWPHSLDLTAPVTFTRTVHEIPTRRTVHETPSIQFAAAVARGVTGDNQHRHEPGTRKRALPSRRRPLLLHRRCGRGGDRSGVVPLTRFQSRRAHLVGGGVPVRIGGTASGDSPVSVAVRRQVRRRTGEQMSPGLAGITGPDHSRGSCRRSIRPARCARSSSLCSDTGETEGSRSRKHRR